jgi:hypothetical protein
MSKTDNNTPPMLGYRVEVLEIRPQPNCGNLRAFATVYLPDWGATVRFVRVVKQPNMRPYAALPQTEFFTKSGEKRYYTVLSVPDELKQEICDATLAAWSEGGQ